MKFLVKFRQKFPIITSLLITALFFFMLMEVGKILVLIPWAMKDDYNAQLLGEVLLGIVAVILVLLFGCKKIFFKHKVGFFEGLKPGFFFIIISIYSAIFAIVSCIAENSAINSGSYIFIYTLTMFMVGFTEEVMFRGLISQIIFEKYGTDRAGVFFSCLISGCMFGFMHAINIYSVGASESAMIQCCAASAMGIMLAAIYYRTQNIWANIFIHGFVDFCGLISSGIFTSSTLDLSLSNYTTLNLVGIIPYIALTFVILRPSKMNTIVAPKRSSAKNIILTVITAVVFIMAVVIIGLWALPYTIENLPDIMEQYSF